MPVCPRCQVAYVDSETHVCSPRRTIWTTLLVLCAPPLGAITGMILVGWAACLPLGQRTCGVVGLFGPPAGFLIGAIVGGVVSFRSYRRAR